MDEVDRGIQWLFDNRSSLLQQGADALVARGDWTYELDTCTLQASFDRDTHELRIVVADIDGNQSSEAYIPHVDTIAGNESLEFHLAVSLTDVFEWDHPGWLASLPDSHRVPDDEMVKIVPWHRIADDLLRTTGKQLHLRFSREPSGWWDVEIDIDDEPNGSFGQHFPSDPEEFLLPWRIISVSRT